MPIRGRSIADLIRMRGDIAAEQGINSADIWGGAIPGIAQSLGQGLAGYSQARQQDQQAKHMQDYARAYDDWLKIMNPSGIRY